VSICCGLVTLRQTTAAGMVTLLTRHPTRRQTGHRRRLVVRCQGDGGLVFIGEALHNASKGQFGALPGLCQKSGILALPIQLSVKGVHVDCVVQSSLGATPAIVPAGSDSSS